MVKPAFKFVIPLIVKCGGICKLIVFLEGGGGWDGGIVPVHLVCGIVLSNVLMSDVARMQMTKVIFLQVKII